MRVARASECVLSTFVVLLLLACWPAKPSRDQVIGKWVVTHSFGREHLFFSRNGTYVQQMTYARGGIVVANHGRWWITPALGKERLDGGFVVLGGALVFADAFGNEERAPERSDWKLQANHEWGRMVLRFSPDLEGFRKE